MELLAGLFYIVIYAFYLRSGEQLVLAAGLVDFHKILIYNASCAKVHVADLGVSHLSVRKTDSLAACLQVAHRVFRSERVNERRTGRVDGIGVVMSAFTPTIQNHKKNFSVHISIII